MQQGRASAIQMGITVLRTLVVDVTSHHLCHVLLVRSKTQVLCTLEGRGSYRDVKTRRCGDHWGHLRDCSPHDASSTSPYLFLPTKCVTFPSVVPLHRYLFFCSLHSMTDVIMVEYFSYFPHLTFSLSQWSIKDSPSFPFLKLKKD